ncbi:MAG: hypothetical protein BHW37_02840 [Firmicutes bacterium CAG:272_52_7]|nr:MAG: hypothetical protein BHW37_02840 [Firmicutes bacterium CAG:272_52_7]
MGKGNRNRELRITDKPSAAAGNGVKLSKMQLIRQQEKKAKIRKYVTMTASIAIVIGLVIGIVAVSLTYYLPYFGLDTSKSLKSQKPAGSTDTTWFAFFMNVAKNQVNELVALASTAQEKGLKLEEKELKAIDDTMKSIKEAAATNGFASVNKYLASYYVNGVTESAVRKCMELQYLASKYYTELTDTYTYTDAQIEKYADDNPDKFLKFDYIYYTFKSDAKSDATDAEKKKALEEAKAKADELKGKITDDKSFLELITEMEKAKEEEKKKNETGTSAASGSGTSDKEEKDYTKSYIKKGAAYEKDKDLTKWVDEKDRKVGDVTVIETKDGDTVTGYSVYYLTKTFYKDEYATKNVRHILFGIGNYGDYADKGGLYENVEKDTMVPAFNDWIYDESRKPGDTDIVETTYGQHVMYFVGDGKIAWKLTAENNLKSEQYNKELKDLEKKYPVTYDAAKLAQIP